ncbi:hypothetical protein CYY_009566 [Polysphondylium violaceum]|uniref:SNF2-related domain-containing protein n=1 Tax=Polysphondylium violaceum TaxID=133409 RepID=A0A8J4PLD5_9MYCE|nr:hypothetical protein CYY_009566 [Polysphondylium violaceum]
MDSNNTTTPIKTRRSVAIDIDHSSSDNSNNSNNSSNSSNSSNNNSNNTNKSINGDTSGNSIDNNNMDTRIDVDNNTTQNKRKRGAPPKKLSSSQINEKSFFHSNEEQSISISPSPPKPTPVTTKKGAKKKSKVADVVEIDLDNPPKIIKLITRKKYLTGILSNISNNEIDIDTITTTTTTTSNNTTTTTTTTASNNKLLVGSLTINSEYLTQDKVYLFHYNDNTSNGFFTDLKKNSLAEFTIDCPSTVFKSILNLYSKDVIDLKLIKHNLVNQDNSNDENSNNLNIALQVYLINESFIENPNATTTNRNHLFSAFKIVLNYFLNTGGVGREFDLKNRLDNSNDEQVDLNNSIDLDDSNNNNISNDGQDLEMNQDDKEINNNSNQDNDDDDDNQREKESLNDISVDIFIDQEQDKIRPFDANEFYEILKMKGFQEISKEKIASNIIATLKRYQLRTVNWMLNRELNPNIMVNEDQDREKIHPLWSKFNLNGVVFYYNEYTGVLTKNPVVYKDEDFQLHGGILADEPGVGKTVEFLGLLVANKSGVNEPNIIRKPLPPVKAVVKKESKEEFKVKEEIDEDGEIIACCCGRDYKSHGFGIWCQCDACQRWQFVACVGSRYKASNQLYFCTFCTQVKRVKSPAQKVDEKDRWDTQTLVESRATLIVAPSPIFNQWSEEIKKHTKDLKVFEYQGIFKTPVTPYQLADYDIVLTTYDALSTDASYMDQTSAGTVLRYVTIDPPKTPLKCVKWWRICLDEAQMVENSHSNYKKLINVVECVNRWCLTGTPIQKGLDDLFGLFEFLAIKPYNDRFWWTKAIAEKYAQGDVKTRTQFHTITQSVMLRNAKSDIADELSLPVQHDKDTKLLRFSMVESHYYTKKAQECSLEARQLFQKYFKRSSISSLDISKILHPLLVLRQICQHPQIGAKGARSLEKNTMTMDQLLERLIEKSSIETKLSQRSVVHAFCCLAAAQLIKNNHDQAIAFYREALDLVEQNRIHFRADWFQELHIFYNLNDIVKMGRYTLTSARDQTYIREYETLKSSYVYSKKLQMEDNLATFKDTNDKISAQLDLITLWWNKSLKLALKLESGKAKKKDKDQDQAENSGGSSNGYFEKPLESLLTKIDRDLYVADNISRKESIAKDIKSIENVETILNKHHNALINSRHQLLNSLLPLTTSFSDSDVQVSLNCSNCRNRNGKAVCPHCICLESISLLRDKLYLPQRKSNRNNKISNSNSNENINNNMFGYENLLTQEANRFVEDLAKDVTTNQGSEIEKILRTLAGYIRSYDKNLFKEAEEYLKLWKLLKQELKEASRLWSTSKNYLNSFDEVDSAIIRIRLKYPGEVLEPHELQFKLNPIEVDPFIERFEIEKKKSTESLKNTLGQLTYLKGLKDKNKDEGKDQDANSTCVICQEPMDNDVVMLLCGHSFCYECIKFMIDKNPLAGTIQCPVCRTRLNISEISYISKAQEPEAPREPVPEDQINTNLYDLQRDPSIEIKGSFGTKIEAILYTLIGIQRQSVEKTGTVDKVIIFSQWSDVLKIISIALSENNIKFARSDQAGQSGFHLAINSFRKDSSVNVLLLLTAKGANGLNLIEATHIFIVEPLLNPAVELQAINRVHRFGQEKETFIHRFIIKNTIEEKVVQMNKRKEKELLGWKLPSNKDNNILSKDDIEFLIDN